MPNKKSTSQEQTSKQNKQHQQKTETMSESWSTLTNEITQTFITEPQLLTPNQQSKIQSNNKLYLDEDNDYMSRHHTLTFARTSVYYAIFTVILLIIATIIFLFYCGGMTKFLNNFKQKVNKTRNISNILQQNPITIPTIRIQKINPFDQQDQPPQYTQIPINNN